MLNLLDFLINPAHADVVDAGSAQGGGLSFGIMLLVFFLFFFFAIWRPQSKRAKEQRDLLTSLSLGDEVITSGGILGKIQKITEQYVALSIHNQTELLVQKSAIVGALPKGTLKTLE